MSSHTIEWSGSDTEEAEEYSFSLLHKPLTNAFADRSSDSQLYDVQYSIALARKHQKAKAQKERVIIDPQAWYRQRFHLPFALAGIPQDVYDDLRNVGPEPEHHTNHEGQMIPSAERHSLAEPSMIVPAEELPNDMRQRHRKKKRKGKHHKKSKDVKQPELRKSTGEYDIRDWVKFDNPASEHALFSFESLRQEYATHDVEWVEYDKQGEKSTQGSFFIEEERQKILRHREFMQWVTVFWCSFARTEPVPDTEQKQRAFAQKDSSEADELNFISIAGRLYGIPQVLTWAQYRDGHMRMSKALLGTWTPEIGLHLAEMDWNRDVHHVKHRRIMSFDEYAIALFELVDIWALTRDVEEYVQFLDVLYHRVATNEDRAAVKRIIDPPKPKPKTPEPELEQEVVKVVESPRTEDAVESTADEVDENAELSLSPKPSDLVMTQTLSAHESGMDYNAGQKFALRSAASTPPEVHRARGRDADMTGKELELARKMEALEVARAKRDAAQARREADEAEQKLAREARQDARRRESILQYNTKAIAEKKQQDRENQLLLEQLEKENAQRDKLAEQQETDILRKSQLKLKQEAKKQRKERRRTLRMNQKDERLSHKDRMNAQEAERVDAIVAKRRARVTTRREKLKKKLNVDVTVARARRKFKKLATKKKAAFFDSLNAKSDSDELGWADDVELPAAHSSLTHSRKERSRAHTPVKKKKTSGIRKKGTPRKKVHVKALAGPAPNTGRRKGADPTKHTDNIIPFNHKKVKRVSNNSVDIQRRKVAHLEALGEEKKRKYSALHDKKALKISRDAKLEADKLRAAAKEADAAEKARHNESLRSSRRETATSRLALDDDIVRQLNLASAPALPEDLAHLRRDGSGDQFQNQDEATHASMESDGLSLFKDKVNAVVIPQVHKTLEMQNDGAVENDESLIQLLQTESNGNISDLMLTGNVIRKWLSRQDPSAAAGVIVTPVTVPRALVRKISEVKDVDIEEHATPMELVERPTHFDRENADETGKVKKGHRRDYSYTLNEASRAKYQLRGMHPVDEDDLSDNSTEQEDVRPYGESPYSQVSTPTPTRDPVAEALLIDAKMQSDSYLKEQVDTPSSMAVVATFSRQTSLVKPPLEALMEDGAEKDDALTTSPDSVLPPLATPRKETPVRKQANMLASSLARRNVRTPLSDRNRTHMEQRSQRLMRLRKRSEQVKQRNKHLLSRNNNKNYGKRMLYWRAVNTAEIDLERDQEAMYRLWREGSSGRWSGLVWHDGAVVEEENEHVGENEPVVVSVPTKHTPVAPRSRLPLTGKLHTSRRQKMKQSQAPQKDIGLLAPIVVRV